MAAPDDLSKLSIDRSAKATPSGARRKWARRLKLALVILIALGVAFAAMRAFPRRTTVQTASVSLVYPSQNYTLLNATGYVVAQRKAAISSKATGRLEWLGVLEGSQVRKGQLIARLENGDVSAALGQAEANVQVAQANQEQAGAELADARAAYRRSSELLAQRFISPATHDSAQARYNKAQATMVAMRAAVTAARANAQAARVALGQTMIRAPFDGVILTKNANEGDNITPFSSAAESKGAVVTLADMDTLEVEADVSESNLARIHALQPAEIALDAFPELRLAGVVSRMVPTLDRSKATLLVKVRFVERDRRVLPDMSAKVAFLSHAVPPADKKPVLALRPAALARRDGEQVAFVLKDGKVRRARVTQGRKIGELVEVSGLAAGDKVVLDPPDSLDDAAPVKLAKE
ncbi:MAG: efflux RND transporter periplasmic adaptor subunit [Telluria sp.]